MTAEEAQSPTTGRSLVERGRRILEESRILRSGQNVADKTATFVRNSWLYGWLMTEAEPEVIVIDLRETYTVGLFIRALDRAIEKAAPWYRQSTLKRAIDSVVGLGERAAETRPGQLIIKLLEPPDPSEQRNETQDEPRTKE